MKKQCLIMIILFVLFVPHVNCASAHVDNTNVLIEIRVENGFMLTKSNAIFRNITTSGSSGVYTITGEARPHNGTFFYVVEDGHHVFVPETAVMLNRSFPGWSEFTIEVEVAKKRLPDNGTLIIYLYEKGPQNKEMQFVFPIVLEVFNK